MSSLRIWLIAFFALLTGCGSGEKLPDPALLPKVAAEAGLQMPASAVLLVEDGGMLSSQTVWTIMADEAFTLPGEKRNVDGTGILLEIQKKVKPEKIGELRDPMGSETSWQTNSARYKASVIRSEVGYFLRIERVSRQ